ncbi:unnamed protein product [Rotaria sp. Silwood1]|nr:unnamed protein product [Rotaria sp. Silwood1]
MNITNNLIREDIQNMNNVDYIDIFNQMLTSDGILRSELFISDNLHMNGQGYVIWTKAAKNYLRMNGFISKGLSNLIVLKIGMASILSRSFLMMSLRKSSSFKRYPLVYIRSISSDHHHQHQHYRPLMLMDLPHIAYPNIFLIIKNFFSRLIINGHFDSTFAIKPFCDGARQALTVVSQLIGNGQFDDLPGFVTREVINEVKQNYEHLSSQQKQQIPVEEGEIIFSCPYLIGLIMDEQANTRMVEITMIFHVLKNPELYREEMFEGSGSAFSNWLSTVKKMRDNIIVCNYKFLRDMSKNASDDSWIITGLNHWSPNEYFQQS